MAPRGHTPPARLQFGAHVFIAAVIIFNDLGPELALKQSIDFGIDILLPDENAQHRCLIRGDQHHDPNRNDYDQCEAPQPGIPCHHRLLCRMIASVTSAMEASSISVDSALSSGVTPRFTIDHTWIGRVVAPGPLVKKVMTNSSSDKVNARRPPLSTPGQISGRVMRCKTCHSLAPRSMAASSRRLSMPLSRARTTTAT